MFSTIIVFFYPNINTSLNHLVRIFFFTEVLSHVPCGLLAPLITLHPVPHHTPYSHNTRQESRTPDQSERDPRTPALPPPSDSNLASSGPAARERWGKTRRTRRCSGRGWAPRPARPAPRTLQKTAWSVPFLTCLPIPSQISDSHTPFRVPDSQSVLIGLFP